MTSSGPLDTRASVQGARVALGRMISATQSVGSAREVPLTMAARATEAMNAVEQVLRVLTGRVDLSGQLLVAEARKQNRLELDDAHAIVAMHEWVERTRAPGSAAQMLTLPPTDAEREIATNAMAVLERAVARVNGTVVPDAATQASVTTSAVPDAADTPPAVMEAVPPPVPTEPMKSPGSWSPPPISEPPPVIEPVIVPGVVPVGQASSRTSGLVMGFILLVVVAGGFGAWSFLRNLEVTPAPLTEQGIAAYARGDRESARATLAQSIQTNPKDVRALIYLGRIARERGDYATARHFLDDAILIEPQNALALREMGSALLADGQIELARRTYVQALGINPNDHIAQGFLGCALIRLQRTEEAQRWFARAGTGDWLRCNTTSPR